MKRLKRHLFDEMRLSTDLNEMRDGSMQRCREENSKAGKEDVCSPGQAEESGRKGHQR